MAKRRRSTKDKLEFLFNQQSVEVDGEMVVICPLCLRVFGEDALESGLLTIEHAPQRSHQELAVERCLTCATCNHECGFEARVGWRKSKREAEAHLLPGPPRLRGWTQSDMGLALPMTSSPHVHGRVKKGLVVPNPPKAKYSGFHPDESLVELKTAYLIAFAALGYGYILDPALDVVRWAIASETAISVCATTAPMEDIPVREHLLMALTLDDVPALLVCMPASHPTERLKEHHVYLPRPGSPDDFYSRLGFDSELETLGGSFFAKPVDGAGYDFPKQRRLIRHWDSCNEDHPRSEFSPKIYDFDCEVHGDERRVFVVVAEEREQENA